MYLKSLLLVDTYSWVWDIQIIAEYSVADTFKTEKSQKRIVADVPDSVFFSSFFKYNENISTSINYTNQNIVL